MMRNKEKAPAVFVKAKICLILGSVLFGIVSLYAIFTYSIHVPGRRKFFQELFLNVIEMTKHEPLGGILFLISVLMLIYGFIQLKKSGWKPRD